MNCRCLAQVLIGVVRPRGWEIDDDESDAGTNRGFARGSGSVIGEEVHVIEAGHAAAQHLGDGQRRTVMHETRIDVLTLRGPDVLL